MYDKKITVIPQTPVLALLINKYKLKTNGEESIRLGRLVEGILSLSEKMMYDVNVGVTDEDIKNIISFSEYHIISQGFYNDLVSAIKDSIILLMTTIILNDLTNTVKYVTAVDDYKIIVETMRM